MSIDPRLATPIPEGIEPEYCGRCGRLMHFRGVGRIGYGEWACYPCRARRAAYAG
jgi:phage/plasmid primase-like uncharacterized protein